MHKTLICVERRDFHRIVDVSRQYVSGNIDKCYIFNEKGYTSEFLKEKEVDGVNCVIFGWRSGYELNDAKTHGGDLLGLSLELDRTKRGYVLLEFENNQIFNYKNKSKISELAKTVNIDKIISKDDFSIAFEDNQIEEEEFE